MSEGTIFSLVGLPSPYPPVDEQELFSADVEDSRASIISLPDGRLRLEVASHGGVRVCTFTTSVVEIDGGAVTISASWRGSDGSVYVNGEKIPPASSGSGSVHIETGDYSPGLPSVAHHWAGSACEKWTDWRVDKYREGQGISNARVRTKTTSEQLEDLEDAVLGLGDLLETYRERKTHIVDYLAAGLRSLVCWEVGGYSPLLLRMAARSKPPLPLPVYMDPGIEIFEPAFRRGDVTTPNVQLASPSPSFRRQHADQRLVDIQEWLDKPIQLWDVDETNNVDKSERYKAREIIVELASTSGTAHYTELLKLYVDNLEHVSAFSGTFLDRLIVGTASTTLSLGRYVLRNFEEE